MSIFKEIHFLAEEDSDEEFTERFTEKEFHVLRKTVNNEDLKQYLFDRDTYRHLIDKVLYFAMLHNMMPYGTAKGRTGDPDNWIYDNFNNVIEEILKHETKRSST